MDRKKHISALLYRMDQQDLQLMCETLGGDPSQRWIPNDRLREGSIVMKKASSRKDGELRKD